MLNLNPTEIYRRYQRKELDKAVAVGYLKSFIESISDEGLRVRSVELLGEMDLDVSEVFEFFEIFLSVLRLSCNSRTRAFSHDFFKKSSITI